MKIDATAVGFEPAPLLHAAASFMRGCQERRRIIIFFFFFQHTSNKRAWSNWLWRLLHTQEVPSSILGARKLTKYFGAKYFGVYFLYVNTNFIFSIALIFKYIINRMTLYNYIKKKMQIEKNNVRINNKKATRVRVTPRCRQTCPSHKKNKLINFTARVAQSVEHCSIKPTQSRFDPCREQKIFCTFVCLREVEWPSGLRRQVKALISSGARVRIPSQPNLQQFLEKKKNQKWSIPGRGMINYLFHLLASKQ